MVFYIFFYHIFVPMFANRIYKIAICPKFSFPQNFRTSPEYFTDCYAFLFSVRTVSKNVHDSYPFLSLEIWSHTTLIFLNGSLSIPRLLDLQRLLFDILLAIPSDITLTSWLLAHAYIILSKWQGIIIPIVIKSSRSRDRNDCEFFASEILKLEFSNVAIFFYLESNLVNFSCSWA